MKRNEHFSQRLNTPPIAASIFETNPPTTILFRWRACTLVDVPCFWREFSRLVYVCSCLSDIKAYYIGSADQRDVKDI
ncbi:Transcriptional regulator ADR1 [Fusarium oxysporum f. sp. albedinis]|nr:Transcriptional regulator ADR1 [Fusarium oxysporum f. sp. albedinis]